jgi:hypothetical protein
MTFIVTDSLWTKSTDALNSNFIDITTLHVSGSLSAHHQEFLAVHRLWYTLCSCGDRLQPGAGWSSILLLVANEISNNFRRHVDRWIGGQHVAAKHSDSMTDGRNVICQKNAALATPLLKFQNMQLTLIFSHFDLFRARNEGLVSQVPVGLQFVVRSDQTSHFMADFCFLSCVRFFFLISSKFKI